MAAYEGARSATSETEALRVRVAVLERDAAYWRGGTRIVEGCLAKAVRADPLDAPIPLVGHEAKLWHEAQANAYRHALEMMGVPADGVDSPSRDLASTITGGGCADGSFVLGESWPDWFAVLHIHNIAITGNLDGRTFGGPDYCEIRRPDGSTLVMKRGHTISPRDFFAPLPGDQQ